MFNSFKPDIKKMEKEKDVEGLIEALRHEDNYYVRIDAAKALGEIGDKRAVEPLIQALKDEKPEVRLAAVSALRLVIDAKEQQSINSSRETLLNYFGSQIRTHAINILTISIGEVALFQVFKIDQLEFAVLFSILSSLLFWQFLRLLYYSLLSSNIIVAKPFSKNHIRYKKYEQSEDYEVTPLKQLYDRVEYILETDRTHAPSYRKRLCLKLLLFFDTLTLKVIFALGLLTLFILLSTSFIVNNGLAKLILEALSKMALQ